MAVDALRKRFGIDSINESPNRDKENLIDHMSGGISHEKRTVDYEKHDFTTFINASIVAELTVLKLS